MLDCLPIYHWFHCGNPYSGAQGGMRYLVAPAKKADPADESGKRKIEYLTATIWPGPWSLEHTADEKQEMAEFPGNQEGLDAAVAWLHERYETEPDKWANIPSILDCEPDKLGVFKLNFRITVRNTTNQIPTKTRPTRI